MSDLASALSDARQSAQAIVASCVELDNIARGRGHIVASHDIAGITAFVRIWVVRLGEELEEGRPRIEAMRSTLLLAIPHRAAMTVGPVSGTSAHDAALNLGHLFWRTAWQAANDYQRTCTETMLERGSEPTPCYGRPEAIEQGWHIVLGALRQFREFDGGRLREDIEEEYLRGIAQVGRPAPTAGASGAGRQ